MKKTARTAGATWTAGAAMVAGALASAASAAPLQGGWPFPVLPSPTPQWLPRGEPAPLQPPPVPEQRPGPPAVEPAAPPERSPGPSLLSREAASDPATRAAARRRAEYLRRLRLKEAERGGR